MPVPWGLDGPRSLLLRIPTQFAQVSQLEAIMARMAGDCKTSGTIAIIDRFLFFSLLLNSNS